MCYCIIEVITKVYALKILIMTNTISLSQMLSYRNYEYEVVLFLEEHLNIKSDSEPQPETGEYLLLHYAIFSYAS